MPENKSNSSNKSTVKHTGSQFRGDNAPTPGYRPPTPPAKTSKKN